MEFFDEAVNKTKEVFEIVSKKTGEAINTGKLKYEISTLENKRDKDFAALGKIYYELISAGTEAAESAAEIVASINEKNEKIEELKSFIKANKNIVVCPKCGACVDEKSVYCNECGEKLK